MGREYHDIQLRHRVRIQACPTYPYLQHHLGQNKSECIANKITTEFDLPLGSAFPFEFLDFLLFFEKGIGLLVARLPERLFGNSVSLDSDFLGLDLEFLFALLNDRSALTGAFSDEISLNSGVPPFSIGLSCLSFTPDIVAPAK